MQFLTKCLGFPSMRAPSEFSNVSNSFRNLVRKGLEGESLSFYIESVHPFLLSTHGREDFAESSFLLPSAIKACSSVQFACGLGPQLHCFVLKTAFDAQPVISNSLISMYSKFPNTKAARQVFDTMPERDSVSCNSLINGYAQNGHFREAVKMFIETHTCGCFALKPELIASIISIISRQCGSSFKLGRAIHAVTIVDARIEEDSSFLSTALVDMYLRARDLSMAFSVFERMGEKKNIVSWTTMVSGCAAMGDSGTALNYFRAMQVQQGLRPNRVTLIAAMPACVELGSLKHAQEVHGYSFRNGFNSELQFSSALIRMYSQFGQKALHSAKRCFERSTARDVVIWSSLIKCCSDAGDSLEALNLYQKMRKVDRLEPNFVTLLALVSACTNLSSLLCGRGVHGHVLKFGLNSTSTFVGNSLISMYSKCGSLSDSYQIFTELDMKDAASWTALIGGCGIHGHGEEALYLFHVMQESGVEPDGITFLSVLSACSHAGLVKEGQQLFSSVMKEKKVPLTIEHYACYLDMLGRTGMIDEACEMVRTMPMKPSMRLWSSLLSFCKYHGKLDVAEKLANRLIESEGENAANYTALSMVCAESGNWLGVEEVRRLMRLQGLSKSFGFSQIV